jgi:hypothetical protein
MLGVLQNMKHVVIAIVILGFFHKFTRKLGTLI